MVLECLVLFRFILRMLLVTLSIAAGFLTHFFTNNIKLIKAVVGKVKCLIITNQFLESITKINRFYEMRV